MIEWLRVRLWNCHYELTYLSWFYHDVSLEYITASWRDISGLEMDLVTMKRNRD